MAKKSSKKLVPLEASKGKPAVMRPAPDTPRLYQLKVTLLGSDPRIWRRLIVQDTLTLSDLHFVLQIAMGWQTCHLHRWQVPHDGKLTQRSMRDAAYFAPPLMGLEETLDADSAELRRILPETKRSIVYEYDMGDSWMHEVRLEKILDFDGETLASCVAGEMRGPPEDIGGVWGYSERLAIYKDEDHDDHDDVANWFGDDYDETAFDLTALNQELAKLK